MTKLDKTRVIKYRIIRRPLEKPAGFFHYGSVVTLERIKDKAIFYLYLHLIQEGVVFWVRKKDKEYLPFLLED